MEEFVDNIIKADRQWKREHRISHARWQLKRHKDLGVKAGVVVWQDVIDANTDTGPSSTG